MNTQNAMNVKNLISITWSLSHEYTFHAHFFEDMIGPEMRKYAFPEIRSGPRTIDQWVNDLSLSDNFKTLYEIDSVLNRFSIIENTKVPVNLDIFRPIVDLPLFYARNIKTGAVIVYPYKTYGITNYWNPRFQIYDNVKTKSFYNFLEENKIHTSMFHSIFF